MKDNNPHILTVVKNEQADRLNHETFCMDELMDELYNYVKNELKIKGRTNVGIELCKFSDYEKCWVHTVRERLRQIFCNLLDNAVKQTDRGYIFYGFHTSVSNNMNFFVDDTGTGIYNDDCFELTIAQGLVEQMGGKIEVRPTKEAGKSVNFNIVCYPCEVQEN